MRLELGRGLRCADGLVQELSDIVIDGAANRVTHLVVQPRGEAGAARLMPIQLVDEGADGVVLSCTAETLEALEPVRDHAYLRAGKSPRADLNWDIGVEDVQPIQDYAADAYGGAGLGFPHDVFVTYDRVPKGEVELRRASEVYSADRHRLGVVEGVVIAGDDRITHLLLERGHLWWRHDFVVFADAVSRFETDMVILRVNKREFGAAIARRAA
jgi:uncharacterized protein YrrD